MQYTEFSREQAAKRAAATHSNTPGWCQLVTRTWVGAPSAGDQNHDGDSDAVDGWQSEPERFRHHKDRKAPRGTPMAWSGGSAGNGHRALSMGQRKDGETLIHSTDMDADGRYHPGVSATVTFKQLAAAMSNLNYLGWSETMDGLMIKNDNPHPGRGPNIEHALDDLGKAKGTGRRRKLINRAKALLKKIRHLGR
jgi:hypothetical protein